MTSDLIIIGSGPGGYRTAEYAAKKGMTVTIFEKGEAGGTCLNCGCIPTKTLCRHAEILDTLRDSEVYGLEGLSYQFNFGRVMERKREVTAALRQGVETLMGAPGITFVRAEARFKDAHTVIANGEEFTAKNIIIATGSRAKMPPIKGIDLPHVLTSTELLDIESLPKRLCIVGAGVIGMEFASIFNSFGVEVNVIEFLKECLPALDSDIAKRLRQTIGKRGVNFFMQSGVKEITPEYVIFERKGKTEQVEADMVLIATGRAANTEDLGLEEAGVVFDRNGIHTDEHLQTNVPGIFAIGDVNGKCMLAHAATFQGLHVVNHLMGEDDGIKLDLVPSAIFTHPEAAGIGMTEDRCKAEGIEYVCKKGYYRANGKALAMNETDGLVKLLAGNDGRLIGCHIYGAHASDMVQEISSLMTKGATVKELADMIHTHPTLSEILQETAMTF
jgi:dihydrolipoamide dehydrogenase